VSAPYDLSSVAVLGVATPVEVADWIIAEPAWDFASNPVKAIGHASTVAADAYEKGRRASALFWTQVTLRLCDAAGHEPGAVLGGLADTLALR